MYLIVVIVVYIIFAKIFIDWNRWKEFYPTVQYYIIFNLLYNFLFYQHTLWRYKAVTISWLNHTFIDLAFTFFIVPVVLMLYLQYFPKSQTKIFFYFWLWVGYFTFLEFIFEKKGLFVYENDWHLGWSTLFNVITFIIIRLHYKNALLGILVSLPIIAILLFLFHPSLQDLK
ncbi:CBO0543 family protein [Sutcliffiella deserti]|uniref:CBO0543 family protein n=1 Tax=Sutcliffiella deserti TaxID=2875501 RepID=UPI001CBDBB7E|nr:CBO0543 family protein [Sutcliffiella deserti]